MPRIYLPASNIKNSKICLTGEKAKYLKSVLRCKKGDDLVIFDGEESCFKAIILKTDRKEVLVEVIEKFSCDVESNINIILVQSLLKGEKMEIVIQKSTELGVKEIIPVITERSQLRETNKVIRWRKIAVEASRQSGRSVVPAVHEPVEFKKIFTETPQGLFQGFIFYEKGGMKLSEAIQKIGIQDAGFRMQDIKRNKIPQYHESCILHRASSPIHIFIGPEGGFTKEEVAFAREKGLITVSLGKRILRAETAAIAAVTLVQFLFGDLCSKEGKLK